ncbi:MAG: hypothetical protein GWO11_08630 [Desulfuromonadales bacterium]|nr:hypothetical protein [Desulfuromonadales bacterium]NIR34361.1 hypothetical protein [Desulfuromonadales bacterium]NIS44322.1 hypothetical protein [Desulfuromonadales bacterium]
MRNAEEQSGQVGMSIFLFSLILAILVGAFSTLVWLGNLVIEGMRLH